MLKNILNIKSRTQNQHYKLATLRGDDPIKTALNEDESLLSVQSNSDNDINVKTEESEKEPKKSRFSFLKRKKKK